MDEEYSVRAIAITFIMDTNPWKTPDLKIETFDTTAIEGRIVTNNKELRQIKRTTNVTD